MHHSKIGIGQCLSLSWAVLAMSALGAGCAPSRASAPPALPANAAATAPATRPSPDEPDQLTDTIRLTTPAYRISDQLVLPPTQVDAQYAIDCKDEQDRIRIVSVTLAGDASPLQRLIPVGATFSQTTGSPPTDSDLIFHASQPIVHEVTGTLSRVSVAVHVMVFQKFITDVQHPQSAKAEFKASASWVVIGLIRTKEVDYTWDFSPASRKLMQGPGFDRDVHREYVPGPATYSEDQPYEEFAFGERMPIPHASTRFEPLAQGEAVVNHWEEIGQKALRVISDPTWPGPKWPN